jgi:uncharacterized protein YggU (UPF0235/DUF167 family)
VIRLKVRLTPKGGRDAIEGWAGFGDTRVLKARVIAVPEDGKANAALIALLADTLHIAKSRIQIVGGTTSRLKSIALDGDSTLLAKLGDLP